LNSSIIINTAQQRELLAQWQCCSLRISADITIYYLLVFVTGGMITMSGLPNPVTEEQLDDYLTTPRPVLIDFIRTVKSPLVILGGGGKMGPSLAVLARRAADAAGYPLDILSVSRFSKPATQHWLEILGVRTISLDLMVRGAYRELPDSDNVLYLVGLKFGTGENPPLTWATNTLVPSFTCERYSGSKIVALSSGNVYPNSSIHGQGSSEEDGLEPLGEYANSCVARERIFDYYSQNHGTPIALIRLSYAVDLRYGVLFDIAKNVYEGRPTPIANGYLNCIWQGDANEMILRSFAYSNSPAYPLNLTGPKKCSVRELALRFADLLGNEALFSGTETDNALLSNTSRLLGTLGLPPTSIDEMTSWTADWIMAGGRSLDKPTHFEVRNGKY
jgi:nucleoside-diphosphate-sugar epimerase